MYIYGWVFSDQTGRFPHTSSRNTRYVMVFYDYDLNAILAKPIEFRSERDITRAFAKLNYSLTDRGIKSVLQILHNKFPLGPQTLHAIRRAYLPTCAAQHPSH